MQLIWTLSKAWLQLYVPPWYIWYPEVGEELINKLMGPVLVELTVPDKLML